MELASYYFHPKKNKFDFDNLYKLTNLTNQ